MDKLDESLALHHIYHSIQLFVASYVCKDSSVYFIFPICAVRYTNVAVICSTYYLLNYACTVEYLAKC